MPQYAYSPERGLHRPAPEFETPGWVTRRCCASEREALALVEHLQAQAQRCPQRPPWEYRVWRVGGVWVYQSRAAA